jgi:hypothetical protein
MTTFSRLLFLLCGAVFLMGSVWQTPRTHKIYNFDKLQKTVLKEVVKIENMDKLQSSNFPQDFEIQMRNISKKPIYFMDVMVLLSETAKLGLGGSSFGFRVRFGNPKLTSINNRPDSTDTPAKPGETFVLKPDAANVKDLRSYFQSRIDSSNVDAALSNVTLIFQVINFGDGTGYLESEPDKSKKVSLLHIISLIT